ncbi:GntR family transcriptional regulator [Spelaeicoccus albus]|uniref:DNA-binding GntR family transcriptional regulator n=1 Tax=Spelaeicoccus albus TaxID=1280376 RepID=A0A7Z0D3P4_9MICO|nr:GntR family transcriptional regulator [Spelaeicoccus albus]NYI68309.1 DNA-binding GntR family transcriptional regulator [Spelaeicoccus albus]
MSRLNLSIDRSSPVPLYHQLAEGIGSAIRDGTLESGTRLDNEIELAAQLRVSRPTMRKALAHLVDSGLLVRKRGVGTQVVSAHVRRQLELSSLFDDLQRSGGTPSTDVLRFDHCPADDATREKLQLPAGSAVYDFTRLRSVDGKPLALMRNWVRDDITELDERVLTEHGLYETLRDAGTNFRLAHQRIGAVVADVEQAERLGVDPGAPLVTMERTAVDDVGKCVETGSHVYRADTYTFEMTLVHR